MEINNNEFLINSASKDNKFGVKLILEDKLFFDKYNSLTEVCRDIFGFSFFLKYYYLKRYEHFNTVLFNTKLAAYITIRIYHTFVPYDCNFFFHAQAALYSVFLLKNYRSFRHIRGLPTRGQRTWSNANTANKSNKGIRQLFAVKAWQVYPYLSKTYSNTAALAEYANALWKFNWPLEWKGNNSKIKKIYKSKNMIKIDLYAMSKFFIRAEKGDYKISKKTKQRRKIEKKSSYTTGFSLGFTKEYLHLSARELRHINIQIYYTKTFDFKKEKSPKIQKKKRHAPRLGLSKGVKSIKVARKIKKKKKKTVWD